MKRTLMTVGIGLAAVLLLGGCMTSFGSDSGSLAYAQIDGVAAGEVSIENGFIYILHPDIFVAGGKTWENVDQDIDPVLAAMGADAVRNLKLGYGATLVDMLLSSVVPVVNWGTYTIEGEAVTQ